MTSASTATSAPLQSSITAKLTATFKPTHLEVINESKNHNVPKGSETHFKVIVVADSFADQSLLNRHRAVNSALADELKAGVHALSIIAKTPQQWEQSTVVDASPACMGGSKK